MISQSDACIRCALGLLVNLTENYRKGIHYRERKKKDGCYKSPILKKRHALAVTGHMYRQSQPERERQRERERERGCPLTPAV